MQHNNAAAAHNAAHNAESSRSRRRVRSDAAHNAAHNAAEAEAGAAPNAAAGNRSRSRSRGNVQGDVSLRSNGTHMTETERRLLEQRVLLLESENRLQEVFLESERRLRDELSEHVQLYGRILQTLVAHITRVNRLPLVAGGSLAGPPPPTLYPGALLGGSPAGPPPATSSPQGSSTSNTVTVTGDASPDAVKQKR